MTPLPILDLIAGMIFIYFLMSIISNSIVEGLASLTRLRANMLTKWIGENLPELTSYFVSHTLLDGPNKGKSTTSYISSANFAFVLIDSICKAVDRIPRTLSDIEDTIHQLEKDNNPLLPKDFARILLIFVSEAREKAKLENQTKTELELFRLSIENWFDSMMERLGGKFKRWASKWTLLFSSIAVLILNIDSIQLAKYLYADDNARNKLAMAAYEAPDNPELKAAARSASTIIDTIYKVPVVNLNGDTLISKITKSYQDIDTTVNKIASFIPIGWKLDAEKAIYKSSLAKSMKFNCWDSFGFWLQKICGLLITILAVSLGAPFWFEVLGKVANLRNSIKPSAQKENAVIK
ncbi:MAG: hypothetical protein Q8M15_16820 [Bacteroidota bacterium]|nr:hypothetical protein [Bacteroidota bacterium]